MAGNYRDSSHRSPVPFEYCTCRCNVHFDKYSAFSRSHSTHLSNTTTTHSNNTHYNRDFNHNHRDGFVVSKDGNVNSGDSTYVNPAANNFTSKFGFRGGNVPGSSASNHRGSDVSDDTYKTDNTEGFAGGVDGDKEMIGKFKNMFTSRTFQERDSPVLSDGTDLTHGENGFESSEFLERLHCASCDKPLLIYTSLDFKLFDNWVNYVFFHKTFSPSLHSATPFDQEAPNAEDTASEDIIALDTPDGVVTERVATDRPSLEKGTSDSLTGRPSGDGTMDMNLDGVADDEYVDDGFDEFEDNVHSIVTYENEDLKSIGDIAGSILMSSEETLFSIINGISPGEQCTSEKNQLFDSVKRFLQYCLGEDTIVHLTGSTAYDIDIDYSDGASPHCNSDLDIVLLSNAFGGDPRVILQKVYNELSNMQHVLKERNKCPIWVLADSNIKLVETAKVPIVIIETKNGLLCDISVNTLYPLLHTELFKSYIDEHPMVRPLMRIIKHWLLVRGLPTMKEGGFPSILWMSLFCNSLDATMVNATSNLELMATHYGSHNSIDSLGDVNSENMGNYSVDNMGNNVGTSFDSVNVGANNDCVNPVSGIVNDGCDSTDMSGMSSNDNTNRATEESGKEGALNELNTDVTNNEAHATQDNMNQQTSSTQVDTAQGKGKLSTTNTANYNYAAAAATGVNQTPKLHYANSIASSTNSHAHFANSHYGHENGTYDEYEYKEEEEEEDEDFDEFSMSETYREIYPGELFGGCSIGQLWERMQGGRGEYGILCSLEKCFTNLSKGLSVMDIVSRFPHIKSGSDYGGMSLFCKNIIRLIEMEPNVPYGTWLVYYYELNRAKEYMTLYSKRLEILVTLLAFLRLLCNNSTSLEDLKKLASGIQHSFGYDLSHLWNGVHAAREYNSMYVNNQYNLYMSTGSEVSDRMSTEMHQSTNTGANQGTGVSGNLVVGSASNLGSHSTNLGFSASVSSGLSSVSTSMDSATMGESFASKVSGSSSSADVNKITETSDETGKNNAESVDVVKILDGYLANVASLFRLQLRCEEQETAIKLLIYHMFQQFKSIPNEIFERVQDNVYSIPVAIEPPSPIEEDPEFGHRFECGLWDDSGWYMVVLQERLCVVKVIKICIEWDFWWSKDFVSRRDTRSIFHGFVYRQLRLDLKKQNNYSSFSTFSVNSPSILVKRGSLVLFNPCDIVSKLHVLKVVKHEQYISPSLYSTDFYTGVKCLYVLPGFEVDRFMCFEQISHKLKHYVEFRPHVTFCKLCGIVNMKKINTYTENKIPQRKLRNAKYVLCNQKYNHIYNLMQYKHSR